MDGKVYWADIDGGAVHACDHATGDCSVVWRGTIRAYAYDPARRLDEGRPWYEGDPSNGVPDGCAQDAEGFIWVACWGGSCVLRLDRDGRISGKAAMPVERVSNVCFAGPALDWMYVTSAGAGKLPAPSGGTWRFRPGVKGKPETPAKGFGISAGA